MMLFISQQEVNQSTFKGEISRPAIYELSSENGILDLIEMAEAYYLLQLMIESKLKE